MAKKRLLDDPRYPEFVERYQFDPLRFAVEVCGVSPSADQIDLYQAMEPMDAKVSVVSIAFLRLILPGARRIWPNRPICPHEPAIDIATHCCRKDRP